MIFDKVYIKGFRNFREATIRFNRQSLIIGANDIGKTNLIYALRILLDRGLSDYDFELSDSDFFAYEETNEVRIRLYLTEVTDECIVARMPGYISDDHKMVIQYTANRNAGRTDYQFYCGKSDSADDLKRFDNPFYRKYLNIKYIGSHRDFWGYINRTKSRLLEMAKTERGEDAVDADNALYAQIEERLLAVDEMIPNLSYVKNATGRINEELDKLSIHNREQKIVFDTASTNIDRVISNVSISSKYQDKNLVIGGEGRVNQVYLSLFASQNQPSELAGEVSIICIEEPEAYLHPHQQRELAAYLGKMLTGQVILTSHSPFIVSEFSPNSIIRLCKGELNASYAASQGCSTIIERGFNDFGYRMSVIPAESFFADCAILVEGPSELMFYKTLAKQIGINLDRLNITVLNVEGVGFDVYIKIMQAMNIKWIMRTDNDIIKIPRKDAYRYAGIERGLSCLSLISNIDPADKARVDTLAPVIHGFQNQYSIPDEVRAAAIELKGILEKYDILLAWCGLEEDLFFGPIKNDLKVFYDPEGGLNDWEIIAQMKERKAINMYDFLKNQKQSLMKLREDPIACPILRAKSFIERQYGAY